MCWDFINFHIINKLICKCPSILTSTTLSLLSWSSEESQKEMIMIKDRLSCADTNHHQRIQLSP